MPYPDAPWTLHGLGLQTAHLADTEGVRRFLPPALDIVPILPGKTLGLASFGCYGPGSDFSIPS